MSDRTKEHSRPLPTAPYAPTDSYAVAVEVEADQPVKASSLQTKTHDERPSAGGNTDTSTSNKVTNVEIELQTNADPGIVFGADAPLRVVCLTQPIPSLAREGTNIEGFYFHSLRLPGLEIKNVVACEQLNKIITANRHLPRALVVSSHAPPRSENGCHYKHDLPATDNLGIHFSGFPAIIQYVDPNSPMVEKIHAGQSVSAIIVPGLADLTMQSGGFTGSRVAEHLQTHCHVPNKQLVVMDQPILVRDNTSSGAFDSFDRCDCVIL